MSRGNQRDVDRARAAKRAAGGKKNDDGLTPAQRNERCVIVSPHNSRKNTLYCASRLVLAFSSLEALVLGHIEPEVLRSGFYNVVLQEYSKFTSASHFCLATVYSVWQEFQATTQ